MNFEPKHERTRQIRHELGWLGDAVRLWNCGSDRFSRLFLANTILEYTDIVSKRISFHEMSLTESLSESAQSLIDNTIRLLQENDLATVALESLSAEDLGRRIRDFQSAYQNGFVNDVEIRDVGFDLIDKLASFEHILATLDRIQMVAGISEKRADFRAAVLSARFQMSDFASDCPIFADEVREYAECEPGGTEVPPWCDLLERAADPLYDQLMAENLNAKELSLYSRNDSDVDTRNDCVGQFDFLLDPQLMSLSYARDLESTLFHEKLLYLKRSLSFTACIVQENDTICIVLAAPELDRIPPAVLHCNEEIIEPEIDRMESEIRIYIRLSLIKLPCRLSIEIPGLLDVVSVMISMKHD